MILLPRRKERLRLTRGGDLAVFPLPKYSRRIIALAPFFYRALPHAVGHEPHGMFRFWSSCSFLASTENFRLWLRPDPTSRLPSPVGRDQQSIRDGVRDLQVREKLLRSGFRDVLIAASQAPQSLLPFLR